MFRMKVVAVVVHLVAIAVPSRNLRRRRKWRHLLNRKVVLRMTKRKRQEEILAPHQKVVRIKRKQTQGKGSRLVVLPAQAVAAIRIRKRSLPRRNPLRRSRQTGRRRKESAQVRQVQAPVVHHLVLLIVMDQVHHLVPLVQHQAVKRKD